MRQHEITETVIAAENALRATLKVSAADMKKEPTLAVAWINAVSNVTVELLRQRRLEATKAS